MLLCTRERAEDCSIRGDHTLLVLDFFPLLPSLMLLFLPRLVSGLSFKLISSSLGVAAKITSFPQRLDDFQDDFTSPQEVFLLLSGSCAQSIVSWPHSGSASSVSADKLKTCSTVGQKTDSTTAPFTTVETFCALY